jgi:hypothetical protein
MFRLRDVAGNCPDPGGEWGILVVYSGDWFAALPLAVLTLQGAM